MRRRGGCLGSLFTNIFLAALIVALYYATQSGTGLEAVPVSAPVYRGGAEEKIALQFTVSWNAAALSAIMDTLAEKGAKATFAISGEWAQNNPALLLRMVSEGHEIATMGSRPDMDGRLSWVRDDVARSLDTINGLCGVVPRLYYSGTRGVAASSMAAKKLGLVHVSGTIDLLCAKGEAGDIISRLPERPLGGSIVLLQPTAACSEALAGILAAIDEKGMTATYTGNVLG